MLKENNFTDGKLLSPMIRFTLPILLAQIIQAMYGTVDLMVVGQFGTAADVSAVSTGSMLMQSLTSFIIGIAMGITIILGQRIGQGKSDAAGYTVEAGVWLFAIITVILTVFITIFADKLCQLLSTPPEAFDGAVSYVRICSSGFIFIVAYNVMSSIMRGIGNSKMPLITVGIACAFNVAGDLLLVGGFNMAGNGAAIATVAAQAVSVFASLYIIKKNGLPFSFKMRRMTEYKDEMGRIFRMGIPIAFQDLLVSISFLVITSIVNSLGVIASAGVGAAEKLCMFIMLVPSSFEQALSTIVAQNIGAGKRARAKKALLYGILCSLAIDVIMSYLSFFHGNIMGRIFSSDTQVIAACAEYLKAYAIDTLLVSVLFSFIGYFNGLGKTTFIMIQGLIGAFGVRIPVAYIMSRQADVSLFKVALATPCSSTVQIILLITLFLITESKSRKEKSKIEPQNR